jgi:hypothetical protein
MKKALTLLSTAIILTCLGYSLIPTAQKYQAMLETTQSLASLRNVQKSLQTYETEHGGLPNAFTWVEEIRSLPDGHPPIEDPLYKKITGIAQPYNPGWGLNSRLELPLGNHRPTSTDPKEGETDRKIKTQDLTPTTILVGPSYSPELSPHTNGELPPQELSSRNPTPTDHRRRLGQLLQRDGVAGLYLFADGSIKRLPPEKTQKYLQLGTPKISPKKTPEKKIKTEPPYWENAQAASPTTVELKNHSRTGLIPINTPPLQAISLRFKTPGPLKFSIQVRFYNQYKQLINSPGNTVATLHQIYGGVNPIPLSKSLPPRTILGFEPFEGHVQNAFYARSQTTLEPQPYRTEPRNPTQTLLSHYQRGTPLGIYKETTKTLQFEIQASQWRTRKILDRSEIPPLTEFVEIEALIPTEETLAAEEPVLIPEKEERSKKNVEKSKRKPISTRKNSETPPQFPH